MAASVRRRGVRAAHAAPAAPEEQPERAARLARPARSTQTAAEPLARALSANDTLAGLLARLAQSRERWEAVAPGLAPELAAAARAGPLDDKGWVIVADHAAAAAKLRQCLPEIEAALLARGWQGPPVKIKVRPRDPS
jgi:hypothetical protein